MGMYGNLKKSYDEKSFIDYIKSNMKLSFIRHSKFLNKSVKSVAVLGGSGSFGIEKAIEKNRLFYNFDLKYHDFFKANNQILLIDIGHYESEKFTKELIFNYLKKKFLSLRALLLKQIQTLLIIFRYGKKS